MSEIAEVRRKLALAELRAGLLERGLDPVYVTGLLNDPDIVEKLRIGEDGTPAADVAAVAKEIVSGLPRNAYREDFSDWAERQTTVGTLKEYMERYVRPSEVRKAAFSKAADAKVGM